MSNSFEDLEELVIIWAKEHQLFIKSDSKTQCLKTMAELGELADAIAKNDLLAVADGIGDTIVTLAILARQYHLCLTGALRLAYNEIKDRKGTLVNGTFVKEKSPPSQSSGPKDSKEDAP